MKKVVIAIGRQLGSGGKNIAEKIGEKLQLPIYDKKLLDAAALESGLDASVFASADERESDSFLSGLFSIHGSLSNFLSGNGSCMESDQLFQIQSEAIRNIAQREDCIIIGRCAEYVLRDNPHMTSIFITADSSDRIARIAHKERIGKNEARELMERGDKKRRSYHDYYATTRWGEAASYDLCINSSILGIEGTADYICNFIRTRYGL